jgi:SAM-dependent methyltransferase
MPFRLKQLIGNSTEKKYLEKSIKELGKWYYYINFGHGVTVRKDLRKDKTNGFNNWKNYLVYCMPEIKGKRILDLGCNAGIYDLEMAKLGASEVVGIERNTGQAEFVKKFFADRNGESYDNVKYIEADLSRIDLTSLGKFDMVCLFCVVYHLYEYIDKIFNEIRQITDMVVLQGNIPRFNSAKYKDRPGTYLAGIEGMVALLKKFGYDKVQCFTINNYPKPLVIGEK